MSQYAAAALLLGLLPSFVVGLGSVPTCDAGFDWAFNSLKQSPCTVASALGEVCIGVDFPIPALTPTQNYLGPLPGGGNQCRCSSVFYSLLSACAFCQGAQIAQWSFYATNCSQVFVTVFQPPIPSGFPVPQYAYLDPTANGANTFNPELAQADTGPESTAVPQATNTAFPNPTTAATKKKSNAGAIAGGVVGGVVGLAIIVGLAAWFILRRRRQQTTPIQFDEKLMVADYHTPPSAPTISNTPAPKLYDPNDPSTFPVNNASYVPSMYSSVPSPAANNQNFPPNVTGGNPGMGYVQPLTAYNTGQVGYTGIAEVMK